MTSRPDHSKMSEAEAQARAGGWPVMRFLVSFVVIFLAGFAWFASQLRSEEKKPERHADGIVVLTGGASRVADGLDLLSKGYGKRLLISGVHPANGTADILRAQPDSQALLKCCVDLDRSAVNTRSNATETRRWVKERGFHSLIVVTSNYHMPRATVELTHAMPDIDLVFYPVVSEAWRDEPWWNSAAGVRLVALEYVKYLVAQVRVRLAVFGIAFPDWEEQSGKSGAVSKPSASAG